MTTAIGKTERPDHNPFKELESDDSLAAAKATNVHGECSIQTFSSAGALSQTHADAQGFTDYLNRFTPGNFRYKDAGVQFWAYTEPYDDWQGVYGSDAVQVFYHSGHGGMDANGVFFAPLGAKWNNKDWVNSSEMNLGNERLRYAFWSTCTSLRVHDGHSPHRTWNKVNQGMRMIFGWETVSWDSPVYGRRFWDHWNARKSFSRAWMDAGWDAGHNQAPSAVGIGASQAEAQNRVFHEGENLGTFQWAAAGRDWWWWTWYDAVRSVGDVPTALQAAPQDTYVLQLGGVPLLRRELEAAGRVSIVGDHLARVELTQAEAALEASVSLSDQAVLAAADQVLTALDLADVELQPHLVRTQRSAGARADGGDLTAPSIAGYAVEYRQVVDGVPVITPQSGYVRVHFDAAGTALSADVTARPIQNMRSRPILVPPAPGGETSRTDAVESALARAAAADPAVTDQVTPIDGSRQIGYVQSGATAHLGVSQGYLADAGPGLQKKFLVTAALNN